MPAALLDTNAVSDLMRDHPKVKGRVGQHSDPVLTGVVVAGEIRHGLSRLPPGKKRHDLEARAQSILAALRIEPVTEPIADAYGRLKASLES
jgi:toxin FitB